MNSALLRGLSIAACVLTLSACDKGANAPATSASPAATGVAAMSEDQKTLYAMGFIAGQQFAQFKLTPQEFATIVKGMEGSSQGKTPELDLATYQPKIEPFLKGKVTGAASARKQADAAIVAKTAGKPGVETLPSGVVIETLTPGTGASPKPTSTVKVHYAGVLTNGFEFDSSIKRGQPVEFELNKVIPCWTEGVAKMKVGGKSRLTCPSDTAYGDNGQGPIPPGATLIFEVELISVK